jgi:hypothetical protein
VTETADRPLGERLADARQVFDERTKGGKGMESIVRGFFLSVVFPQLRKSAEANPRATEDAIIDMVGTLVRVLGVTRDQLFPDGEHVRESEPEPPPRPN